MSNAASLVLYLATLAISSLFFGFGIKRNYRLAKYLGLALPIALASARYMVGTDYQTYISIYDKVSRMNLHDFFLANNTFHEVGFFGLIKLSMLLTHGPYLMFALSSAFTIIFFYLGLKKYNPRYLGLTYFLYLMVIFPSTLNLVRQGLAISIVFYAITYLIDRNPKKFIFWILIAGLFHTSALLIMPLYFINKFVKENKSYGGIVIKTFLLSSVLYFLLPGVANVLSSTFLFSKYEIYQTTQVVAGNNLTFLLNAIVLGVILIFSRYLRKIDKNVMYYVPLVIIALTLSTVGFRSSFINRISLYLTPFILILITNLAAIFSDRLGKHIATGLVVAYGFIYFYIAYYLLGQSNLFPFQFLGGAGS